MGAQGAHPAHAIAGAPLRTVQVRPCRVYVHRTGIRAFARSLVLLVLCEEGVVVVDNNIATFSEFAGIARYKPSYITALRTAGRLVLTEDGKRVRVAESLARIEATRDPSKVAVAERHALAREATGDGEALAEQGAAVDDDDDVPPTESSDYQHWRSRRERALALREERANAVDEGKLMNGPDVIATVSSALSVLRGRLESMADIIGAQLTDPKARTLIAEGVDVALAEVSRRFGAMAKVEGP